MAGAKDEQELLFSLSIEIGPSVIRTIKGKEGSTLKQMEEHMGVKIFISSPNEDSIIIKGISLESVTIASERVKAIIYEAVDYTHFISLPLAIYPELINKFVNFQNSILENSDESQSSSLSDLGIDKYIFAKPESFHLTVLMLKLWNNDRVKAAAELLKSISSKVLDALDNQPVFVRLKGLDCFSGSLDKARILYAPVEEIGNSDRLLRACQVIIDAYHEAGLVSEKDAKRELKLHAT